MKAKLELGAELEFVSPAELDKSLDRVAASARAAQMEQLRGVKYRRLPALAGVAAGGALNIGGDAGAGVTWPGTPVGPQQGYAWDIGLLSVAGLTSGVTPDTVQLFITGAGSALPWWQFTGNAFFSAFGRGELIVLPGETLVLKSVGTFAATGTITLFGSVRAQVPAEMLGKVTT